MLNWKLAALAILAAAGNWACSFDAGGVPVGDSGPIDLAAVDLGQRADVSSDAPAVDAGADLDLALVDAAVDASSFDAASDAASDAAVPPDVALDTAPWPDTNPWPDMNPWPDTTPWPDMNPWPDTTPWPDVNPWPDTTPWPDTAPWPDTTPWPDMMSPPTCTKKYGAAPGFKLCKEDASSCLFYVAANDSCTNVCSQYGGTCLAAAAEVSNTCAVDYTTSCGTTHGDGLCTCSR